MTLATTNLRSRRKAWMLFLGIGACFIAASVLLPLSLRRAALIDLSFPLANVVAIVVGVRWFKPDRLRPWALFAVGMTCFLGQNTVRAIPILFSGATFDTGPWQNVFQSAGYLLIIAALISLIYNREGGARDRSSLIDASIIVVGAAMLAWVFVLAPFAHDVSIPLGERLFKMMYPVANLVLLAVSVRLAVSRGAHTPAFLLLLLAMVASLIGNTLSLYALEETGSFLSPANPVNNVFFLAYLFAAAAPLHPTMKTLSEVGILESRLTRTRIALFLGASTTGLVAYAIERARGQHVDVPVILVGSFVIFVLVLVRLSGLNKAMRRSEERFRSLVQNASDAFAILDLDGTVRYVSPASERVLGFTPDELIGADRFDLAHPDYVDEVREFFDRVVASPGRLSEMLLRVHHKDRSWRWLRVSCTNMLHDPSVEGIVANFHDVTETKEAEEALRAGEQSSRLLFESSPLPMWVFDQQTLEFLAVNDAAIAHYGYSRDEFLTMALPDIRPEEEVERLHSAIDRLRAGTDGVLQSGEWIHRLKDGRLINVEVVSHALDFEGRSASLAVSQDVTERKVVENEKENLERQLRQSQKLEAVGQLAGGVAHDFNNLLAVILNYGRFVQEDMPEGDSSHEDVEQILSAAEKAARLVKQLLAFSRREIVKPEIVDVNEIVEDINKMLVRTTKESIELVMDLQDDLWHTMADPGQLEQVILNLAVNADSAMANGGTLEIRTTNKVISEIEAAHTAELRPGSYVCLSVSDNGVGMSKEVAAHVFEPFFTTKAVGEGTGLGLSTVYGIVKQAGGYVYVDSAEGRGTTFTIYLPASDETALAAQNPQLELAAHSGTETILVVEDEEGVRAITYRILTAAGYKVVLAESPAKAIEIVENGLLVDLLLTDVIMPGMSGKELSVALRSQKPQMKTMFMSGYTDEIIARQGILEDGLTFVQKPFGAHDLLPLVRKVLQSEQPPLVDRPRTVLIVDDEKPMRDALRTLLDPSRYQVVGEAEDARTAIELAREVRPELIVLDYSMPRMTGAQAAALLRDASPGTKICAFSSALESTPPWADAFLSKERIGEVAPVLDGLAV